MKRLMIIAGAIATLTATSCKKDSTHPGPGEGSSKVLKKVTKTEEGAVTVYNLTYENNRLAAMKNADNTEATIFSYDGAGNLTRIEEKEPGTKTVFNYVYANNVPVTGNIKSWQITPGEPDVLTEDDELAYTVAGEQVTKIHLKMKVEPAEAHFNLSYANGNLSSMETEGEETLKVSFTYGNKKPLFPKLSKYVLDHTGFSLLFASKNDLLTSTYDFPGTESDYSITNQYTYDADGNILTSTNGTTQFKLEYQ